MLLIGIDQLKMITKSNFEVFGSLKTSFHPTEVKRSYLIRKIQLNLTKIILDLVTVVGQSGDFIFCSLTVNSNIGKVKWCQLERTMSPINWLATGLMLAGPDQVRANPVKLNN